MNILTAHSAPSPWQSADREELRQPCKGLFKTALQGPRKLHQREAAYLDGELLRDNFYFYVFIL